MTRASKPIPEGFHSVTPSLIVRNAAQAIDFYKRALGAQELMRMTGQDRSEERRVGKEGRSRWAPQYHKEDKSREGGAELQGQRTTAGTVGERVQRREAP